MREWGVVLSGLSRHLKVPLSNGPGAVYQEWNSKNLMATNKELDQTLVFQCTGTVEGGGKSRGL